MPVIGFTVTPSFTTRRLSDLSAGLPPSTTVASTVWPVDRSSTRTFAVVMVGLPSCWIVGAPCSCVTDPITRTGPTGRQLKP